MKGDEYIGKSKEVRRHKLPGTLVLVFTDRITDKDGLVQAEAPGKGRTCCQLSRRLFALLAGEQVPTHYLDVLSSTELLVAETEPIPIEVVVRRIAAGSLLTRVPVRKGQPLSPPLVEFFYKKDEWHDPLIAERHILEFGICTESELDTIISLSQAATDVLARHLTACDLELVDIKYEFGRALDGSLMLIDELTPEVFRARDKRTGASMDKDVFREGRGPATATYEALLARLVERFG